ncbi:cobalt-precorrin-5B (C(1))-methyltransferase CbiD [Methanopyrus kandleri]|uniref:Cobalt-precorrin-5B C(1)-methyltransferase n=2 Tax=Methanopyrus kandleri TaxID=2320 RepID=CBID_METKA|nr:cobalt-precorrin-5B (C(1))-methyltransferase CbiD [Methanopyrus kandleri]Q8TYG5.1 RecName: Full=Cobalt-precorrin-5B C(1)-methyltransferase; AltName: Full=Cobalt-precorrin-6A synthase [Methanopyrus kandleri AV19]AAM01549.1 Cobalamin biosynthesis protein CbiD [Methanopyrus kandleri AV19]HII70513.1 cobalt-precorrin-5B (C(1))-methyltransferase [Methanopyrus kandleri]
MNDLLDPIRGIPVDLELVRRELDVDLPTARYLVRTGLITTDGARVLRRGPTTGTCATAAAKAAAIRLLEGRTVRTVRVRLPVGTVIGVRISRVGGDPSEARVRKPGSDDHVDVTTGVTIAARVEETGSEGVEIRAGRGVGETPSGKPAISEAVREQIVDNLRYLVDSYGVGLRVTIEVPDGEEIARKTLAHRHGIEGGISILGTKGLVDPNSEEAIEGSIRSDLRYVERVPCLVTGYRTMDRARRLGIPSRDIVNCHGRYDLALEAVKTGVPADGEVKRFDAVLIFGMPGKLLKLAAGAYNTHAKVADARRESLVTRLVEIGRPDLAVEAARHEGLISEFLRSLDPDVRRELFERVCELVEERVSSDHDLECGCALYFRADDSEEVVEGEGWKRLVRGYDDDLIGRPKG